VISSRLIAPIDGYSLEIHGEGGSEQVRFRPQKSLDMPIRRFFASLRFDKREKLDQLGIEIGSFD
jgi:hypothetical protein